MFIKIVLYSELILLLCATQSLSYIDSNQYNLKQPFINSSIKCNDQSSCLNNQIENVGRSIVKREVKNDVRISMKANQPRPGQKSLVLVFDATSSMKDDLDQLRKGVTMLVNKFSKIEDNPFYNYIFVPFREENGALANGPSLVTDDKDELLDALNNVDIYGGDDCPKTMLNGMMEALNHCLPFSYVYAFSDASIKDYFLEKDIIEVIQRKQITITFLLTGYCNNRNTEHYKVFDRLIKVSNGQLFDITTQDIGVILQDVTKKLDKQHTLLISTYSNHSELSQWTFPVDETMKNLNIMIAGEKAKVWFYDPTNIAVKNKFDSVSLIYVKGYTIENPVPGEWQIETFAHGPHSVRLTANSKIHLSYGFSVESPNRTSDISHFTPWGGLPNILTIVSSHKINLTEAHLQFDDAEPIILPLIEKQIENTIEFFYETAAFEPPKESFKILVTGYDEKMNPIKRMISTTVQELDGVPPKVTILETNTSVTEGETLFLKCNVQSLVPSTIRIYHNQKEVKRLKSNESMTNVQYEIESSEPNAGSQYTCVASNQYGLSNQSIQIEIMPTPLVVTIPDSQYIGTEKQSQFKIPSTIVASSKFTPSVKWYFNGAEIVTDGKTYMISEYNLIIQNVIKELSGNYSVVVKAGSSKQTASTQFTVYFAPILNEIEVEEIYVTYGEPVVVNCTGLSLPQAQIKWKFPNANTFETFDESPLQIESFEFLDEGVYECNLDNGIEPIAIRKVTLKGLANGPPNISKTNIKQLNVSEGDDINLTCHCEMCEPLQMLLWNRIENLTQEIISDDSANIIDYTWYIKNISKEESGTYECSLFNEFGNDTFSIDINVKRPPKIEDIHEKNSFHKCSTNENVNLVELESENGNLTVPFNVYDCIASNVYNRNITIVLFEECPNEKIHSIAVYLNNSNVISRCRLNKLHAPDLTQILNGTGVEENYLYLDVPNEDAFECILQSNNTAPFNTNTLLAIFVTSNLLSENDTKLIQVTPNSDPILKCSAKTTSPSKWIKQPYNCETFSNISIASNSFYFLVHDAPKIQSSLEKNIRLLRGEHTSITCSAIGSNVKVYWTDDQSTKTSTNVLDLDTKILKFNEKNFTCVGENAFGKDSHSICVRIIDRPELSHNLSDSLQNTKHIQLGSNLNLTCPFEHFNHFKWLKNGKPFNSDMKDLSFSNVSITDVGNYTIHVENEAGYNEYTYEIVVQYAPIFQNTTMNGTIIDVTSPSNFSIDCKAHGFPVPELKWMHNGQSISTNETLFIEHVSASNHGKYTCTATNENGATEIVVNLNVLFAPMSDTNETNQIIKVVQNHSVVLNCLMHANPEPIYEWYKHKVKISGANRSLLEIPGQSLTESGNYTCIVSNTVSSSVKHFTLDVYAIPSIQSISENKTSQAQDGKNNLLCNATGNPMPTLSSTLLWINGNQTLFSSSKSNLSNDFRLSELCTYHNDTNLIEKPFGDDQDNIKWIFRYKCPYSIQIELHLNEWPTGLHRFDCFASNTYGHDERSTFIEYVSKPTFSPDTNASIDIGIGEPIDLNCDFENAYPPVEKMLWKKNGIAINFVTEHKYMLANDNRTLHISSVTTDDGFFTCIAENSVGVGELSKTLNILSPPRLASAASNIKMRNQNNNIATEAKLIIQNGQEISLECPIEGNPRPKISWMEMISGEKHTSNKMIDVHNLTLKRDSVLEDTTFICYANNSLGSFNYTFRVFVEKAPSSLASTQMQIKLNMGGNFSIKCDVEGLPEPKITWYKNDNILTFINHTKPKGKYHFDNKKLLVTNTNYDDFGVYVCVAENNLGKTEQSFDVIFNPYWGEFSEWSECNKTCGIGFTERNRTCIRLKSHDSQLTCIGDVKEVEKCMKEPCSWSRFSACSRTCGMGQMYRFKGNKIEIVACNRGPCTHKSSFKKQFGPILTYESSGSSRNNEKINQYYNQENAYKSDRYKMTHTTNHSKSIKKSRTKMQDRQN
ncbi:hemicentin-1-like [Contarinia nasturtii]|uniref:hemicentin-1-like n=1 Tax=Contarinia nasturtii TaxID=265458 RepID=UPI0012D3D2FB|nr:hemicentin-1-like [Contarinia nasturtii]